MPESAAQRAEIRDRLRRALIHHETLEHEHAKLGYEVDRLSRENSRLKNGGAMILSKEEVEYLLWNLPKLKGRPTAARRSVEDKLLDALLVSE